MCELEKLEMIKSNELSRLAIYLAKTNKVTFYGVPWSEVDVNWVYFDCKLELDSLSKKFNFGNQIRRHVNNDPRSGLESGFIDNVTGEGVMGI